MFDGKGKKLGKDAQAMGFHRQAALTRQFAFPIKPEGQALLGLQLLENNQVLTLSPHRSKSVTAAGKTNSRVRTLPDYRDNIAPHVALKALSPSYVSS